MFDGRFMTTAVCHSLLLSADIKQFFYLCVYLRSALHLEGAHGLEAELHHIAALGGELMATALEALLIEDNDLRGRYRRVWIQ